MAEKTSRDCIAIIPARGGSKGIPRKNLRLIGGIPLVARSILAARGSSRVDAVYVSTDDPEIAKTARQFGAEVIERPVDISGDTASSEAALIHGLGFLSQKGISPSLLVFLQCTSPLTTSEAIDKVVAGLDESRFAMALSVAEDHGFLWRVDENGEGFGVNHDASRPRARRQDLPPRFRETGAIYVMRVPQFLEKGNRFCGSVKPVPLDLPTVEIDSPEDLLVIEAILEAMQKADRKQIPPPPGIKALVTDFDGVHTDDCVYVDENGKESVRCSRSDGMGIEMLKKAGIDVLILSKEINPVVAARAAKLRVSVIQGCNDKKTALLDWLNEKGFSPKDIAYVGNDINDLECLSIAGWSCCPADGNKSLFPVVSCVSKEKGGQGVLRSIAEMMQKSQSQS